MDAKVVYLGGPIDGTDASEQDWRLIVTEALDLYGISYYDPLVANQNEIDPVRIVNRNMAALNSCRVALFAFPVHGQFGFGSPIELWQVSMNRPAIVFTSSRLPHIYLRYLEQLYGVRIVHSLSMALQHIRDLI